LSIDPIIIAKKQINPVAKIDNLTLLNPFKTGKTSSSAIEYNNLGAPARDYMPAPQLEAMIAIITSQAKGQLTSAAMTFSSSYKVSLSPTMPNNIGNDM